MLVKKEVLEILKVKNNEISIQIIEIIDIFEEQELIELKIILLQNDVEKLKEALLYKHWVFKKTLDRILILQKEFHQIKTEYINNKTKKGEHKLEKQLDNLLENL